MRVNYSLLVFAYQHGGLNKGGAGVVRWALNFTFSLCNQVELSMNYFSNRTANLNLHLTVMQVPQHESFTNSLMFYPPPPPNFSF